MNFNHQSFSLNFLTIVVVLQIVLYISIFFNFGLARAVVGTVYLTLVPGWIAVKLLKLEKLGTFETILFSVGFSVAFLMVSGLIIDQFGYMVGLSFPLATLPLSLFINTLIIIGAAVSNLTSRNRKSCLRSYQFGLSRSTFLLVLIPVLSIIGVYLVNLTNNNLILIAMIFAIAGLFVVSVFFDRSKKSYAFAVLMIAFALLMHVSLVSNYILPYGGDSPVELYVFRDTQLNSYWDPIFKVPADEGYGRYNAMLSITILPTVYSNILGLDSTWVYKIIFPLIFSFVPVGLYFLWVPYIGKKMSFIAAFLFMAQSTFFTEMLALNRQMIAELFFVLLLLVLLNKKISKGGKFAAFSIFSFGLILSHYALAEIFLFLILAAWAASVFYLKRPSFNLQFTLVIFFFVAMFVWYIYTSGSVVFDSFMSFTGYIGAQLGEFFNPASRGQTVLTGLGLAESPSMLNTISRGFAYLTELFIVIGVFSLVRRKLPFRFERDYVVFSVLTVIFLVFLTLVPGLANALSMTRFYHVLLMILSPLCVVGMWVTARYFFKHKKETAFLILTVVVLVPYFLFQTNLIYELSKTESWSVPLSGYRMEPGLLYGSIGYIDTFSVYGANWVSANVPYEYNIAADVSRFTSLNAYGLVYRGYTTELAPDTLLRGGEFAFLSYISINYEQQTANGTLPKLLNQTSVIYSNGNSEVYYIPMT